MSRLSQVAISAEGFVFDPISGECFTVNSTGLSILKSLQEDKSPGRIAQELTDEYDVPLDKVEKDILDFRSHLQIYNLL